jgi:predicted glycogen debranching enzyme
MFECLRNASAQFTKNVNGETYLLAGYPWFKVRARDEFIAMPGCTIGVGNIGAFEALARTAMAEIMEFMEEGKTGVITELDSPDAMLWFIWALQQYYLKCPIENLQADILKIVPQIVDYIIKGKHPNLQLHENGLLYVDGTSSPMTWMNAVEDGKPITPRTGYVVEINALWYNALCLAASLSENSELQAFAENVSKSFEQTFWNGLYLYDYVVDRYRNVEVRPNMILAVSMPYSPLTRVQQKSVLDVCTRELLTTKGLRSLSPKSGSYRPNYVGGMLERNRNYHNGPVWPWFTGAYAESYLKIHKMGGVSFVERLLIGMEAEMKKLCIGTLSELHDGNPPFKGHGAMSYAPSVGEILRTLSLLKEIE